MERQIKVYCDGSCYNKLSYNTIGVGFVVVDPASLGCVLNSHYGDTPYTHIQAIDMGVTGTNNTAEYMALIQALEYVTRYDALYSRKVDEVVMYSDSRIVIEQINGNYAIRGEHLQKLHHLIQVLTKTISKYTQIRFEWVSRNEPYQKLADRASKVGNPYFYRQNKHNYKNISFKKL